MTLVELMVAIAVGMFIVAGMAILFANNSRSRAETERAAHKIENGRFALEVLRGELQHAGYFSVFDPRQLTLPAALPDPCSTTLGDLKTAMPVYVQGYDDVAAGVLSCLSGVKAGTDVVVVRRAATCVQGEAGCTGVATGAPAFQASSCNTELASGVVDDFYRLTTNPTELTLRRRGCPSGSAGLAPIHRYIVRIYYVATEDKSGDGIPTLKRAELTASSSVMSFVTTSLVQGVENLQVEYGLDNGGTPGNPDEYVAAPNGYMGCNEATSPTCVEHWSTVVSARVHLLTRGIERSPGHQDAKKYVLGGTTVGPFADAYKRSVFQEVIRFNNVSARRFSPS